MHKKFLILCAISALILGILTGCALFASTDAANNTGTTYYVSFSEGKDENDGKSVSTPWKTLARVSQMTFKAGDKILLKSGDKWEKETLTLNGDGTAKNPILLSSYGKGNRPVISPNIVDVFCISASGIEGWKISNLELCNAREGIDIKYDCDLNNDFLWIENVYFHDMDHTMSTFDTEDISEEQKAKYLDHGNTAGGINIRSRTLHSQSHEHPQLFNQPVVLTNLTIKNCDFFNCDVALWASGTIDGGFYGGDVDYGRINGINIENCRAEHNGMWAFCLQFCDNAKIKNFDCIGTGFESNRFGSGSVMITYGNDIEYCDSEIAYQYRHPNQNFDAVAFDTEGGDNNVALRRMNIHDIAGYPILLPNNCDNMSKNIIIEDCTISDFCEDYPGTGSQTAPVFSIYGSKSGVSNEGLIRNNKIYITRPGVPYIVAKGAYSGLKFENNTIIRAPSDIHWEFNMKPPREGWTADPNMISDVTVKEGHLDAVIQKEKAVILSPTFLKLDTENHHTIRIKLKNGTNGTTAKLYWISDKDVSWDDKKMKEFAIKANDKDYSEYILNMSEVDSWAGIVSNMKLIPSSGTGPVSLDEIVVEMDKKPVNIIPGTEVKASSAQNGYEVEKIKDGKNKSINDGWASEKGKLPASVELNFKAEKPIGRVEVYMSSGYEVKNYKLEYWDGFKWNLLEEVKNNKSSHRSHKLKTALLTNKLRIFAAEGSNKEPDVIRFSEIEVYRDDSIQTTDKEEMKNLN